MPPGEIRCWTFAAACDGVDANGIITRQAASTNARRHAIVLT
jgi:hypothetical protein